jgi:signal transduction histidine kinase
MLAFPDLDTGRTYHEIRVIDNGIGFNQEYAAKIFTIFQRLNPEPSYSGFGIGLALCHKIVSNHGGHIYAEGKPGQGAVIGFILPALPHSS